MLSRTPNVKKICFNFFLKKIVAIVENYTAQFMYEIYKKNYFRISIR